MIDAVLASPRTRSMYMRRLRTLMDEYTSGRLEKLVNQFYEEVREEAARDNAKWGNRKTAERGREQMLTEQLPIRRGQLYDTYGPDGPIPLIPDKQPSPYALELGPVLEEHGGGMRLQNPNAYAIDLSGHSLRGPGTFVA
ncbi:hypothetical protein H632_c4890p0, partial [Helicosporidium sp. ATCC 50920]